MIVEPPISPIGLATSVAPLAQVSMEPTYASVVPATNAPIYVAPTSPPVDLTAAPYATIETSNYGDDDDDGGGIMKGKGEKNEGKKATKKGVKKKSKDQDEKVGNKLQNGGKKGKRGDDEYEGGYNGRS